MSNGLGLTGWAPATAVVMCCLVPAPSARNLDWAGSYENGNRQTANTVVTQTALPRTASVGRGYQPKAVQDDGPWREPLNDLRGDLHATVIQLARAFGVRRQSVHAWQRGEKAPSPENQVKISQLQVAAAILKARLGARLPAYLNYPLGDRGESFWDGIAAGKSAPDLASVLLQVATASMERRGALDRALEGVLGKPLDGRV